MRNEVKENATEILVVDDVEQIRSFIRVILLKLGFEKVETSSSSQDVIERLRRKNYDMIFLDINLPGVDGLSLLRLIRDKYPKIKVIMCTGNSTEQNVKEAISAGAAGFLAKPVLAKNITALFDRLKVPYISLTQISR
ncbi:MAG: response regulator [Alteromonadaceae bacterium]|nr:response regulator [Alteromonadaceae bacterium]